MTQIDAVQPANVEAVLSVKNLTISLPRAMERAHAVNDVSFDLMDGEILCIIGESGSGNR